MPTLDERYGQLWWNPATGAVQDDRPGFAAPAPSANYIRNEATGEVTYLPSAAPQAAPRDYIETAPGQRYQDPLGIMGRGRTGKLDDPFGLMQIRDQDAARANEVAAYKMADYLSQFLPPERVAAETRRLTGVDLSGRLASTPKALERAEKEAGITEKRAKAAETRADLAKKEREMRELPLKDYETVEKSLSGLNRLEDLATEIKNSDALWRTAGPIAGRAPSLTAGATNIEAKIKALKAQVGFRVLQEMRDASKTGGALGNVSERELDFLQNALAALDLTQSPEAVRQSLDQITDYAHSLREQATRGYAQRYGAEPPRDRRLPVAAQKSLREGVPARFENGQVWTLQNGVPRRLK